MVGDSLLHYWYRRYNKLYFNEALPMDIGFDRTIHIAFSWELTRNNAEFILYNNGTYGILVDYKYSTSTRISRILLLHEMNHLANEILSKRNPFRGNHWSHGEAFHDCVALLWKKGAYKKLL